MQSTEERFWSKVNRTETCWLWTASIAKNGYGQFNLSGKPVRPHRLSYEMANGPIPDGFVIDHLCRVRACVNPAHLEAVPFKENCQRGVHLGTHNLQKTHCPAGHEYTSENTYVPPKGGERMCRECKRATLRRWRQRQAANAPAPQPATHCKRGHELTTENTYVNPDGIRRCRTCITAWSREYVFQQA